MLKLVPFYGVPRTKKGSNYNGSCPINLEQDFLGAYTLGYEIYQTKKKLLSVNSSIETKQEKIKKVVAGNNEMEQLLIHGKLTPTGRARLLTEIKGTEKTISKIEDDIYVLEGQRIQAEEELADLNSQNIYQ